MKLAWLIAILGALCACNPPENVVIDSGRVCVEPEAVADHEASADLILTVRLDECISACAQDTEATCDARLDGDEIVVHSEGRWADSDETCIAVCASLEAECVVEDLPPGEYTVRHGEASWPLVVPAEIDAECLG